MHARSLGKTAFRRTLFRHLHPSFYCTSSSSILLPRIQKGRDAHLFTRQPRKQTTHQTFVLSVYIKMLRHFLRRRTLVVLTPALRPLSTAPSAGRGKKVSGKPKVSITFMATDGSGDKETVQATVGDSLLDVAHDNDIEIEGACGGEMACSTCHVILPADVFARLPKPKEEEEDMLDLFAFLWRFLLLNVSKQQITNLQPSCSIETSELWD